MKSPLPRAASVYCAEKLQPGHTGGKSIFPSVQKIIYWPKIQVAIPQESQMLIILRSQKNRCCPMNSFNRTKGAGMLFR